MLTGKLQQSINEDYTMQEQDCTLDQTAVVLLGALHRTSRVAATFIFWHLNC